MRLMPGHEWMTADYQELAKAAAGEGIEPDADGLFYAQLYILCRKLPLDMSVRRIDRGGSLKISHKAEAQEEFKIAARYQ